MQRRKVLVVMGTRPEAIKLAPVILELKRHPKQFKALVLATAQHRRMLDQVLSLFAIRVDADLNIMRPGQNLADLTCRALLRGGRVLDEEQPDIVLVQGDTTTAFASALAAYYRMIPVGHVEAGLRTKDRFAPYPEEMNRRLIGSVADIHFAPTRWAADNLLREGVPRRSIHVTGNTGVDALRIIRRSRRQYRLPVLDRVPKGQRLILVTAHRRESFGPGLERICRALAAIARRNPDVEVVYSVHLNPKVRKPVKSILSGLERVHLIDPVEYLPFVRLMERSCLILTDSGGIQEEAPALGKPVLVLRDKTERAEAVRAGTARLVGTAVGRIVAETERLLHSQSAYARMARTTSPFGDGHASHRIARILRHALPLH